MADSLSELQASLRAVSERLDRVERRYRALRAIVGAGIAVIAGVGLIAAASSQTIRAHTLELVDSHGRVRIRLNGEGGSNQPYVGVLDTAGRYRVSMQLSNDQDPELMMWNSRKVNSFSLVGYGDHGATEQFYDNGSTRRLSVGEYTTRAYGIDLYDARGVDRLDMATTTKNSSAWVEVLDVSGRARTYVGTDNAGKQARFIAYAPDGTTILADLFADEGGPGLKLFDTGGYRRLYAGEYSTGTWGIDLLSRSGTTEWKAP